MKDKKKFDLKILDIIVSSDKTKLTFDKKNNQLISKKLNFLSIRKEFQYY